MVTNTMAIKMTILLRKINRATDFQKLVEESLTMLLIKWNKGRKNLRISRLKSEHNILKRHIKSEQKINKFL